MIHDLRERPRSTGNAEKPRLAPPRRSWLRYPRDVGVGILAVAISAVLGLWCGWALHQADERPYFGREGPP